MVFDELCLGVFIYHFLDLVAFVVLAALADALEALAALAALADALAALAALAFFFPPV
jgi:hypothetical protein